MQTQTIKIDIECQSCGATGLYQGFAEKNGCAIVCHTCNGTGKQKYEFKYTPFTKRKLKKGVTKVFQNSCGYGHTIEDIVTQDGKIIEFSKGGISYEDWLEGGKPKPVKDLYCPYLWTNQRLQTKDVNNLYKNRCNNGISIGSYISKCKHFENKHKCWEIFEKGEKNGNSN